MLLCHACQSCEAKSRILEYYGNQPKSIEPHYEISNNVVCATSSLRPACAYPQSDQSLCLSPEYSITVKLLSKQQLEILSLSGGCAGSSESTLVKMPHCWESYVTAQLVMTGKFYANITNEAIEFGRRVTRTRVHCKKQLTKKEMYRV